VHDRERTREMPKALGTILGRPAGAAGATRATPLEFGVHRGLLLDGERKSIEPLAARLPEGNVQAMQQLIGQSPWPWAPVWQRLAQRMTAELRPDPVWVIDDTVFPSRVTTRWEWRGNIRARWARRPIAKWR